MLAEVTELSCEPKVQATIQIPGISTSTPQKAVEPSPRRMALERRAQDLRSEISVGRNLLDRLSRETVGFPSVSTKLSCLWSRNSYNLRWLVIVESARGLWFLSEWMTVCVEVCGFRSRPREIIVIGCCLSSSNCLLLPFFAVKQVDQETHLEAFRIRCELEVERATQLARLQVGECFDYATFLLDVSLVRCSTMALMWKLLQHLSFRNAWPRLLLAFLPCPALRLETQTVHLEGLHVLLRRDSYRNL